MTNNQAVLEDNYNKIASATEFLFNFVGIKIL